ncbi:hypothetical protein L596_030774 [Steinernema carpocapsae]|uniref:Uncharacterized protein n=1 Tax=Steinernema carpocapsae TaxID=34508 RepID=A0A4U5LNQ3_STECR|nr:hypothetical protein L596_030774 [Steinernema carpocapsae]
MLYGRFHNERQKNAGSNGHQVNSNVSRSRFSSTTKTHLRTVPTQPISSTAATGLPSVTSISETTTDGGRKTKKRRNVTRFVRSSTEAVKKHRKPSSASDVTMEFGYTATT